MPSLFVFSPFRAFVTKPLPFRAFAIGSLLIPFQVPLSGFLTFGLSRLAPFPSISRFTFRAFAPFGLSRLAPFPSLSRFPFRVFAPSRFRDWLPPHPFPGSLFGLSPLSGFRDWLPSHPFPGSLLGFRTFRAFAIGSLPIPFQIPLSGFLTFGLSRLTPFPSAQSQITTAQTNSPTLSPRSVRSVGMPKRLTSTTASCIVRPGGAAASPEEYV